MSSFMGMRGSGNFAANERPESWLQGILYEYPNGDAPLIAISSMMKSEPVDDPHFHWWTKSLPSQRATVTGSYINAALSTAYVYATHQATHGVTGGVVYMKMSATDIVHFRIGHQVVLRDADRPSVTVLGKVIARQANGNSSYIGLMLLEADDNDPSPATYNISTVDVAIVGASMQPEGSPMPDAIAYNPIEYENFTQIIETPLFITRTAMRTKLRTEDAYLEAKREAAEIHSIAMEMQRIFGVPYSGVGDNAKKERSSMGWLHFIKTYAPNNVSDFPTSSIYAGKTWVQAGKTWLNASLEQIFRYGSNEKLALCGSGALLGINTLAETYGSINLVPGAPAYGIKVKTWETPVGTLHLKTHPKFNQEETMRYSMLIIEPKNMIRRVIDDVTFKADNEFEGGVGKVDGKNESFISEDGCEFHFPNNHGFLTGVGQNNNL